LNLATREDKRFVKKKKKKREDKRLPQEEKVIMKKDYNYSIKLYREGKK